MRFLFLVSNENLYNELSNMRRIIIKKPIEINHFYIVIEKRWHKHDNFTLRLIPGNSSRAKNKSFY